LTRALTLLVLLALASRAQTGTGVVSDTARRSVPVRCDTIGGSAYGTAGRMLRKYEDSLDVLMWRDRMEIDAMDSAEARRRRERL